MKLHLLRERVKSYQKGIAANQHDKVTTHVWDSKRKFVAREKQHKSRDSLKSLRRKKGERRPTYWSGKKSASRKRTYSNIKTNYKRHKK